MPPAELRGLLLDIGGVVHSTAMHLVGQLAEQEPAMLPVLERIGGLASDRDELWQRMLRRPGAVGRPRPGHRHRQDAAPAAAQARPGP